jgi:hypothetical protein
LKQFVYAPLLGRPFVFVVPPGLDWASALARHGEVVERLEEDRDAIVIPFHPVRAARCFAPTPALYEMLDCVASFVAFMERGFPSMIPKRLTEPFFYPCVVKQPRSLAGSGVRVAWRVADLPKTFACVQEPIYGRDEYVEHVVVCAGAVKARVRFAVRLGGDLIIKRGLLAGEEITADGVLDPIFKRLDYTGFACVNFKLIDGAPKIFEINPRMGGSLVFSNRLSFMLECVRDLFNKELKR